jgi:hypothetical protein
MATSGAITATMTAFELVGAAMRRGRLLREGQTPDAQSFEEGRAALTRMLKSWTMDGANLWRDAEQTIDLVSGTSTYTLSPRVMRVRNVRLVEDSVERNPLGEWGRDDYDAMPRKTQAGRPTVYVVNRLRASVTLILWPVPNDSTWDLKVGYERVIDDVTAADEEIDAPQEWFDAVIDNLAIRLADQEPLIDPRATVGVRAAAAEHYERAQGHDRSGPVIFEVGSGR